MIMKANHGGNDFNEEDSPFFPDVPLNFAELNSDHADQSVPFELRADSIAPPSGPKMLRRRLMDEIRNMAIGRSVSSDVAGWPDGLE